MLTAQGHFTNPVDNLYAATTALARLPINGDMPLELVVRNAIAKLKTAVV
jgi:hypothetical protein